MSQPPTHTYQDYRIHLIEGVTLQGLGYEGLSRLYTYIVVKTVFLVYVVVHVDVLIIIKKNRVDKEYYLLSDQWYGKVAQK
jgi:hypothetical protein